MRWIYYIWLFEETKETAPSVINAGADVFSYLLEQPIFYIGIPIMIMIHLCVKIIAHIMKKKTEREDK